MTMPKKGTRTIVVDGKTYRYKVTGAPEADTNRMVVEDTETHKCESYIVDKAITITPKTMEAIIKANM
jgi:hypothetical protein